MDNILHYTGLSFYSKSYGTKLRNTHEDFLTIPHLVLVCGVIHYLFQYKLSPKIGKKLGLWWNGPKWVSENQKKLSKFNAKFYNFVIHFLMVLNVAYCFLGAKWFVPRSLILPTMSISFHKKYSFCMRFFYLYNFALYTEKTIYYFYLLFFKPKRKEPPVMLFHHVLTLILVYGSFLCGSCEYGILILFNHNISDVLNYSLRMLNELIMDKVTIWIFPISNLSWLVNRCIIPPMYILAPGWLEIFWGGSFLEKRFWPQSFLIFLYEQIFYFSLTFFRLAALYVLQVKWYLIYVNLTIKVFKGEHKRKTDGTAMQDKAEDNV